jgi:hypothetical protein
VFRILYTVCVAALIGGTAWSATGMQGQRMGAEGAVGIVLLAALQR